MAKVLKEAAITTREARKRLPAGLHFRGIDPDIHLGYRKGRRGGVWLVRWRYEAGYRQRRLGTADDAIDEGTLDFNAAVKKARQKVATARAEAKAAAAGPVLTVRGVIEAYVFERDTRDSRRRGRAVRSDATRRLERYLIGREKTGRRKAIAPASLAAVALHTLTETDLLKWRTKLPASLAVTTKQRLVNDVKAALNGAYAANRGRLDPSLPAIIKHGLRAEKIDDDEGMSLARGNQILTDAQVAKLLRAAQETDAEEGWEGDLFRLVVTLAATGARFSQVTRMAVGDVQRARSRVMVPPSRKGRGARNGAAPVPVGSDVLDALSPAMTGRASDAPLLERWRSKQITPTQWQRIGRGSWQAASELVRPWHLIRDRAGLPEVIPYALRHSSIVRGIRANLPIRLVAALHDTSVAMIERHYGRWIADGLDELAARAVVPLVPRDTDKIVKLAERW